MRFAFHPMKDEMGATPAAFTLSSYNPKGNASGILSEYPFLPPYASIWQVAQMSMTKINLITDKTQLDLVGRGQAFLFHGCLIRNLPIP